MSTQRRTMPPPPRADRVPLRERCARLLPGGRATAVPTAISMLLAAAIVAEATRVGLAVHDDLHAPPAMRPGPAARQLDPQAVIRSHLFGAAPEDRPVAESPSVPSVLSGTIAFTDPARGSAIIAVNGSAARLYLAGSDLPDGARLSQVFPEYVLLERGGATETLRLPRRIGSGGGTLLAGASDDSRARGAPVDFGLPAATRNPREFSSIRRWFGGFSGRQAPSPDGQFHGLLVRPMPRYRREYDLRDGDVIKAINGVPLENADTAGQVLQQARGASVSLTVLRKEGTTEQLTLKVGS